LIHSAKMIWRIAFASYVQVSGVRFQQPYATHCIGIAHGMHILPQEVAFSCNLTGAKVKRLSIY
jgi:hypothetical protein